MSEKVRLDEQAMALRVVREFSNGDVVNLGHGLPVLASNMVAPDIEVLFHTENGILGFGEVTAPGEGDHDVINASGQMVTPQNGMSFFDQAEAFSMIRGGHVDISVLGAYQVSEKGDLSNWKLPTRKYGTIGGGMDLAAGAKRVIAVMCHTTRNGDSKILKKCTYPITAPGCVKIIVTDIAVIEVVNTGLVLKETAPGWTPEEVQNLTEPTLFIAPDCHEIALL